MKINTINVRMIQSDESRFNNIRIGYISNKLLTFMYWHLSVEFQLYLIYTLIRNDIQGIILIKSHIDVIIRSFSHKIRYT